MKHITVLALLLSIVMESCAQETPKVKHRKTMHSSEKNIGHIKVYNEEDPVCRMKTAEYLKDTLEYKHKTYGFCSTYCKDEFKMNPEKYVQK